MLVPTSNFRLLHPWFGILLAFAGALGVQRSTLAADPPAEIALQSASGKAQIVFATAEVARTALTTPDEFVKALSPFDRSSRLKSENPVDQASFLKFVGEQTLDWADIERQRIAVAIDSVRATMATLKLPLPPQIVLIKTTGLEEGNAAYTRGNAIILPKSKLVSDAGLAALFCHELFHVLSRQDSAWRNRMYGLIGFRECSPLIWPDDLRDRQLTNPDAPSEDHAIKIKVDGLEREAIPILFSRSAKYDPAQGGQFFDYMVFKLVLFDMKSDRVTRALEKDGKPLLVDPRTAEGYLQQIGRNTNYIIHPDETLADNFVMIAMGKSEVPSPDILAKIKNALTEASEK